MKTISRRHILLWKHRSCSSFLRHFRSRSTFLQRSNCKFNFSWIQVGDRPTFSFLCTVSVNGGFPCNMHGVQVSVYSLNLHFRFSEHFHSKSIRPEVQVQWVTFDERSVYCQWGKGFNRMFWFFSYFLQLVGLYDVLVHLELDLLSMWFLKTDFH